MLYVLRGAADVFAHDSTSAQKTGNGLLVRKQVLRGGPLGRRWHKQVGYPNTGVGRGSTSQHTGSCNKGHTVIVTAKREHS